MDRVKLGPVSSLSVEVFTPAGRLHWGNVNSLCGSLGTVFHLPSRNCFNEARHTAFHPSLPAIRHSSRFELWPQQSVCIQRVNVVGSDCPLTHPHNICRYHPGTPGVLYFSGFGVPSLNNTYCSFSAGVCLPQLKMNPLPKNTEEGHMVMICRFS